MNHRCFYFPVIIISFLAFWQCAAQAGASQWSSLRKDAHGSASTEYHTSKQLYEWYYIYKSNLRYRPGLAVWSSPALAVIDNQPMVYIGGHSQALLALNIQTRQVAWLKITNGEIGAAPAVGTIRQKPVVFFGSADRTVYALDAVSGKTQWTKELIPPSPTLGTVTLSSPLLFRDYIYITCFAYDKSAPRNRQQANLFCLSKTDGRILWKIEIAQSLVGSPVGFQLDDVFYIAVTARKGIVQCFRLENNQPQRVWSYLMPHEVMGSPVVETNVERPFLFLGSKFGNFVALDARTGQRQWQFMAGNWIDNTACIGTVDNENVVFVGSNDYKLYAFKARTGELLWATPLGGEIFSAPAFFHVYDKPMIAAACLDDRVYALDARTGRFKAAFFSGEPIWNKVPKGETLMGSPAAFSAGKESVIVYGAYSGSICIFPVVRDSAFRNTARSFTSLWLSLPIVLVVFLAVILPLVLKLPVRTS